MPKKNSLLREDRAAEIAAELVQPQLRLRDAARDVEHAVRVQDVVAELLEHLAVERVRAAPRDELDLRGAFRAGVGGQAGVETVTSSIAPSRTGANVKKLVPPLRKRCELLLTPSSVMLIAPLGRPLNWL